MQQRCDLSCGPSFATGSSDGEAYDSHSQRGCPMTKAMMSSTRVRSHTGRFFAGVGAAVQIILLGVGASVAYGILQDQITAHLCVEYFTIGHIDYLNLGDPTLIAVEWGLIATWWAGLLLGLLVALVARVGARPRLGPRDLLRPTLLAMTGVGLIATIAGIVGYLAAGAGAVYLLEPLASAVPRSRHVAFLTDLWAHDAAYLAGALAGIALCVWTWRRRSALRRVRVTKAAQGAAPFVDDGVLGAALVRPRWEVVVLRALLIVGGVSVCLGILVLNALWGI